MTVEFDVCTAAAFRDSLSLQTKKINACLLWFAPSAVNATVRKPFNVLCAVIVDFTVSLLLNALFFVDFYLPPFGGSEKHAMALQA